MMALCAGDKSNFATLKRAAVDDNLILMDCRRKADGAKVALICAVNQEHGEYVMVPLAVMIEGDPYELFDPPDSNSPTGYQEVPV